MARRSGTSSKVVGVHRVHVFPLGNLHGARRWAAVIESEDGSWHTEYVPTSYPRPSVGDAR